MTDEIRIEEIKELKPGSIVMMEGRPYIVREHPLYGIRLERIKTPEEIEKEKEKIRKVLVESARVFGKAVEEVARGLKESISKWLEEREKKRLEEMKEGVSKEKISEAI